jgi:hypothetical protein
VKAGDQALARWHGPRITLPRDERIKVLKAAATAVSEGISWLLAYGFLAEEEDWRQAAWAKANSGAISYRQHLQSRWWRRLRVF